MQHIIIAPVAVTLAVADPAVASQIAATPPKPVDEEADITTNAIGRATKSAR